MSRVECFDCGGDGRAIGQDGTLHVCTNCGGDGYYNVPKSEVTDDMKVIDE